VDIRSTFILYNKIRHAHCKLNVRLCKKIYRETTVKIYIDDKEESIVPLHHTCQEPPFEKRNILTHDI